MKKKACLKLSVLFFGCLFLFGQCSSRNDPEAQKERLRLGRSFDNPSVWKCLTLLTRVHPNDGYASIAPMRLRDIGFSPESDFDALAFAAKKTFLDAVRFPLDRVNESGLVMGLANVTAQPYTPDPSKETIHFCLWVRKVLDECRTVDEAVGLTMKYNILSSGSTLDVHAMVADAFGHSIILEPVEGEMKVISSQGSFQVMTNSPVYRVPLETQLVQCSRFRFIYETLEAVGGSVDGKVAGLSCGRWETSGPNGRRYTASQPEAPRWPLILNSNPGTIFTYFHCRNFKKKNWEQCM